MSDRNLTELFNLMEDVNLQEERWHVSDIIAELDPYTNDALSPESGETQLANGLIQQGVPAWHIAKVILARRA